MPLHSDARGRELPFCLGLVRLQGRELLQHAHGPEVLNRIFRLVGEQLAAAPQVAPAVARWGDDAVVVALQRLGPRVAADVLRELVQRMENRAWPDELTGLQLRLRAGVIDAAQYPSVDSAADSLYLLRTANRVWPLDAGA
jgi:GGDEF domain-containing protein